MKKLAQGLETRYNEGGKMHIKTNIAKTVEEFVDYRIPDIIDCMEG